LLCTAVFGLPDAARGAEPEQKTRVLAIGAQPNGAEYNSYSGTTANGPVFDRLIEDCATASTHLGTRYSLQPFTVAMDGDYAIHSEQDVDGIVFVYAAGFDPDTPSLNCLIGDDDGIGGIGTSDLTATLVAGTQYLLVTAEFDASNNVTFTNTIQGPGEIVLGATYGAGIINAPTYDRPQADCVSQQHPGVRYVAHPFVVDTDGEYSFTSAQDFDGFIAVYASAFNRSNPLGDCQAGDDDGFNGVGTSSLATRLNAGTNYVLVTAGYDDTEFGLFTNTVAGPGRIAIGGVVYEGSTIDGPVFNRADASCLAVSAFATAVAYDEQVIVAPAGGSANYTFSSIQDYDGYLHLYAGFDDQDPLFGCLAGDDDAPPGIGTSLFQFGPLSPFTSYEVVTSGYENSDAGHFTNLVSGPVGQKVALYDHETIFAGTTAGEPEFERPFAGNCSVLSGDSSPFVAAEFTVNRDGNYAFAGSQAGWDGYVLLYEAPFTPADGTLNCLEGNDDGTGGIGTSQFIAGPLKAFRRYVLVTTGYEAGEDGDYAMVMVGPGSIATGNDSIFGNGLEGR
jgi:hypothetical protein